MGAATHLSFSVQPSSTFDSEVTLPQQPVVQALDSSNAVDTTYTGLITLSVPLGNLVRRSGGNMPVLNCVAGVASFTDINVSAGQACALVASASGLTSATSATMTPTAVGGRDEAAELPRVTPDTTYPSPIGATYTVGSGKTYSTVQAAINAAVAANTGTTHAEIIIDPGTYTESLSLPKATGTGWIVLRPATLPCASGTRAQPSMFTGGVKLATAAGTLNVACANGAHHFRFVGLEVVGNASEFFQFAEAANPATSVANCPDMLGIDRCYVHGTSTLQSVRAIEYQAKSLFLIDSYFAEIHTNGNGDTQVIAGWNAPGPLLISNCYLEAAGEITMFGGADSPLVDVVTSDITITKNHYRKPLSWKRPGTGTWDSKNLTELKSARRVLYDGNVFENQWYDAQNTAITFGSASQAGGSPWMGIRDVTFRKNLLRNASRAIILNKMNSGPIGPYLVYPVGQGTTGTSTTGGTLASGTYYYQVTQLFNTPGFSGVTPVSANASGVTYSTVESAPHDVFTRNDEIAITTGAGSTNSNTISWRQYSAGCGWRVYRGTSSGGENVYFDVPAGTLSFTDTGAAGTAGTPPTTDVAAIPIPMHRASVHDNLFIVNNTSPYDDLNHSQDAMVQGVDDTSFVHNTLVADAETGWYLGAPGSLRSRFDYNITSLRRYAATGDVGGINAGAAFNNEFPASVTKNVALDLDTVNYGITLSSLGGTWAASTAAAVGFADPTKLTGTGPRTATIAQLLSAATLTTGTYANTTWTGDGKMVGADMTALSTAINGVVVTGEGTNLAGDTSGIGTGAADHLAITTQPSASTVSGVAHAVQPSGAVQDASNVTVFGDASTVTASWVSTSGTGSASGTTTATVVAGVWTFTNLGVTSTLGCTGRWHFTDGALTSVDSASIAITPATTIGPAWLLERFNREQRY